MKTLLACAVLFSTAATAQVEWNRWYDSVYNYAYLHPPMPHEPGTFLVPYEASDSTGVVRTELRTYHIDGTLLAQFPFQEAPTQNTHVLFAHRDDDGTVHLITYRTNPQTPDPTWQTLYFHTLTDGVFTERFTLELPPEFEQFSVQQRTTLPDGGSLLLFRTQTNDPDERICHIWRLTATGIVHWQRSYTAASRFEQHGFRRFTYDTAHAYFAGVVGGDEYMTTLELATGHTVKDIRMGSVGTHAYHPRLPVLGRLPNGTPFYIRTAPQEYSLGYLHPEGFDARVTVPDDAIVQRGVYFGPAGRLRVIGRPRAWSHNDPDWNERVFDHDFNELHSRVVSSRYRGGYVLDTLHNSATVFNGSSGGLRQCALRLSSVDSPTVIPQQIQLRTFAKLRRWEARQLIPTLEPHNFWLFLRHRSGSGRLHHMVRLDATGRALDTLENTDFTFSDYHYAALDNGRFLRWWTHAGRLRVERLFPDLRQHWTYSGPIRAAEATPHRLPGPSTAEYRFRVGPDDFVLNRHLGRLDRARTPSAQFAPMEVFNLHRHASEHWFDTRVVTTPHGAHAWEFRFFNGRGETRTERTLPLAALPAEPIPPRVLAAADGNFVVLLNVGTEEAPNVRMVHLNAETTRLREYPYRLDFMPHPFNTLRATERGLWMDRELLWLGDASWTSARPPGVPAGAPTTQLSSGAYVAAVSEFHNNAWRMRLVKFRIDAPVFTDVLPPLECPEFTVAPNPNGGTFRWTVPETFRYPVRYLVADATGRVVHRGTKHPSEGDRPADFTMRLGAVERGVYRLVVQDADEQRAVQSFLVW